MLFELDVLRLLLQEVFLLTIEVIEYLKQQITVLPKEYVSCQNTTKLTVEYISFT